MEANANFRIGEKVYMQFLSVDTLCNLDLD